MSTVNGTDAPESSGADRGTLGRLLRKPAAVVSLTWIGLLLIVTAFSSPLAPADPLKQNLLDVLAGPSSGHLLGTDSLGRDVLSRLMYATDLTLLGGLLAVAIGVGIGVPVGLVAGFVGGWVDRALSRLTDMMMSLPHIMVLMAVLAVFGSSLWVAMIAFGVLLSAVFIRIVRGATQSVRGELYVDAARVAGVKEWLIVVRHVLPSVTSTVIVQSTVLVGVSILVQAGLMFLGLGPAPPEPTWGGMIEDASTSISLQPWLMVPPGVAIILTVIAFNLLGDALRDSSRVALRGSVLTTPGRRTSRGSALAAADPALDRSDRSAAELLPGGSSAVAGDALLAVRDLAVSFGDGADRRPVVDGVSFDVGRGETVGLVGESGCGKTMTMLAVLGLVPQPGRVERGTATFEGRQLTGLRDAELSKIRGARIGLVSQEPMVALDPSFTVASQLSEPLRAHGGSGRAAARRRSIELLELVGIPRAPAVARKYPHELSGGMAQRVAIALALTGSPSLLIADEPTTALDVTVQAEILDLLRSLQEQTGMALVLVTHDLGVVADICTRALVMYAGQIVEQAPTDELFNRPAHPYTAALLSSVPSGARPEDPLIPIAGSVPAPGEWPTGCRFADRCPHATDVCRAGAVGIREIDQTSSTRCVRAEELLSVGAR